MEVHYVFLFLMVLYVRKFNEIQVTSTGVFCVISLAY